MRPAMVFHVAWKEILSTLRDRRAIVSNLLIPFLLLPVIMLGLPYLLSGLFERETQTVTEIGIEGLEHLPSELREYLEAQNVQLMETTEPRDAVERGDYPAAVSVPQDFTATLEAGDQAELVLYSKPTNMRSDLTASKVQNAVNAYRQTLVAQRLQGVGLDPSVLEPVTVQPVDASTESERASGVLSWLIPFFIIIWSLAGGQMTAIDATAGEKERGTLEALLVSPVRRQEVVVGKFLATMAFGLSAAIMAILGYVLGGTVLRSLFSAQLGEQGDAITTMMGGSLNVNLPSVLMLIMSSLLMAALVGAVLMSITMFARSFKEAQTYIAPLSFVIIIPAVGVQFATLLDLTNTMYLIPFLNMMLVMDQIVKGNVALTPLLLTWGSTLGYTAILLAFADAAFRRESVIFRT
jgi:sodium transport system permease protein